VLNIFTINYNIGTALNSLRLNEVLKKMKRLDGKVAVITGSSRGLGLGIARVFAAEGAAVVLASRSQAAVDQAVEQIKNEGGRACGLAVNVADLAQVKALAQLALYQFGKLDIWVNNAGVAGPYGPVLGFSPEDFYQVIETNITGLYNGSRTAMQYFLKQKSGKLINMLGAGNDHPLPYQTAYGSSKMWVRAFTLALAKETEGSGVGVFAFNPGMVLTDLLTNVKVIRGAEERLVKFPKIVRILAKPAEVAAQKAVWLASSATDGKTGLLVSNLSPFSFPLGALREWRRSKQAGEDEGFIKMQIIPPADD
jgi:glucose 1-dehydrogenase